MPARENVMLVNIIDARMTLIILAQTLCSDSRSESNQSATSVTFQSSKFLPWNSFCSDPRNISSLYCATAVCPLNSYQLGNCWGPQVRTLGCHLQISLHLRHIGPAIHQDVLIACLSCLNCGWYDLTWGIILSCLHLSWAARECCLDTRENPNLLKDPGSEVRLSLSSDMESESEKPGGGGHTGGVMADWSDGGGGGTPPYIWTSFRPWNIFIWNITTKLFLLRTLAKYFPF